MAPCSEGAELNGPAGKQRLHGYKDSRNPPSADTRGDARELASGRAIKADYLT
jgi:hypothetical protein